MINCLICHFDVELDDIEIPMPSRRFCICVRCWHRMVDDGARAVEARLRREAEQAMKDDEPKGGTP